jgi:hypothetical protein
VVSQYRRLQTGVALVKETTWGTGVNPVYVLPSTELSESPQYNVIIDQGMRAGLGARDFKSVQGGGWGEFGIEGFVYPEATSHVLLGIMGAVGVTGGGPYEHTMTMGNNPPSFTVENMLDSAANSGLRYTGARVGNISLSFAAADGVLEYSSQWMSKIPTKVTAINPALANDNDPFAGWRGTVTSTGLTAIIVSGEMSIERELEVVHTAQNAQDPRIVNVGALGVSGRLVITAEDMTIFDAWKAHTTQSFAITFTYGASAIITITLTSANLGDGPLEIDRSGVGVTFAVPFRGLYNATDAGPLKIVVTNALAAV